MPFSRERVESHLRQFIDPYLNQDWITSQVVKDIKIDFNEINIYTTLGYPAENIKNTLISQLKEHFFSLLKEETLSVHINWEIASHTSQRGINGLKNIKNIIPVASGKGGVGKSTAAANIAAALAQEGARVGILDADIYGPSQPLMLGAIDPPEIKENKEKKILFPILRHGIQSMSIGYLISQQSAMIWRGPMVTTALQQLLHDTQWDNLDYLIVDLPPGTGDIQLTLAQKIPVSAAVIVTTPQDLALMDVRRAYEMFSKVNIPVLGMIENMAAHVCNQCGHADAIFGEGGGERFAKECGIDFLGSLPLDRTIREQADTGIPIVIHSPKSAIANTYRDIAGKIAGRLSLRPKDYSAKFRGITIKRE